MPGPMGGGMRGPGRRMQGGKRIENPGKVFKRLMAYIFKNYAIHFIFVLICIVLSVVASIQGTLFMQRLIDDYILPMIGQETPDFGNLFREIVRVAGFYLVGVAATYAYNRIMVTITQGTLKSLRDDLFEHMEKLPIKYFDTHSHGDIMSIYTNDIDTLRQMISQSIPQVFSSFITVVGTLGSMLVLSIPLTAVSLIMVALMMFVTGKVAGLSGKYFVKQQKNIGTVNGYIEEMMEGQKVVKVFCHEDKSLEEFKKLNDELCESAYNANKFANLMGPINAQLGNLSYVVCAIVGGAMALGGFAGLTLGKLASFLTFNKSFNMPISQVSQQLNSIVMAQAGAKRVFDLLDEKVETDEGYVTLVRAKKVDGKIVECPERTGMWAWKHVHQADGSVDYIELQGEVVFDDVDFGYTPEKTVLHGVSLYAKPGQKVAFVGSTGAGKTTIFNVISGVYPADQGSVTLNGQDITKIEQYKITRLGMGRTFQNIRLFKGLTVEENVMCAFDPQSRYSILGGLVPTPRRRAEEKRGRELCRKYLEIVGMADFLNERPENLSYGMQRRIEIARALMCEPKVLLLDEPAAGLNPTEVSELTELIQRISKEIGFGILCRISARPSRWAPLPRCSITPRSSRPIWARRNDNGTDAESDGPFG